MKTMILILMMMMMFGCASPTEGAAQQGLIACDTDGCARAAEWIAYQDALAYAAAFGGDGVGRCSTEDGFSSCDVLGTQIACHVVYTPGGRVLAEYCGTGLTSQPASARGGDTSTDLLACDADDPGCTRAAELAALALAEAWIDAFGAGSIGDCYTIGGSGPISLAQCPISGAGVTCTVTYRHNGSVLGSGCSSDLTGGGSSAVRAPDENFNACDPGTPHPPTDGSCSGGGGPACSSLCIDDIQCDGAPGCNERAYCDVPLGGGHPRCVNG